MIAIPTEDEVKKELEIVKELAYATYSRIIRDTKLSENEVYGETVFNYLRKYYIFFCLNEKDLSMLSSFIYKVALERSDVAELLENAKKRRVYTPQMRDTIKKEMQQLYKNIKHSVEKAETIRKKQEIIKKEFDELVASIKYMNRPGLNTFLEFMESAEKEVMKTYAETFKNVADVTNGTINKYNELYQEYEAYNKKVEGVKNYGN